jgi:hypothetical protein
LAHGDVFAFEELDLPHSENRLTVGFSSTALLIQAPGHALVVTGGINAEDSSNVTSTFTGNTEFSKDILPLVEPDLHGLANLVLADFGVMSGACDGIEKPVLLGMLEEDLFKIFDSFLRVKAM